MNYYDELGLPPTATTEEIREAYRKMARLLHPDQQQSEEVRKLAEIQMKRLNTIVEVLTDAEQRRRYDQSIGREALSAPAAPVAAAGVKPGMGRVGAAPVRERPLVFTPPPRPPRTQIPIHRWFGWAFWVVTIAIGLGSVVWYFATESRAPQGPLRAPGGTETGVKWEARLPGAVAGEAQGGTTGVEAEAQEEAAPPSMGVAATTATLAARPRGEPRPTAARPAPAPAGESRGGMEERPRAARAEEPAPAQAAAGGAGLPESKPVVAEAASAAASRPTAGSPEGLMGASPPAGRIVTAPATPSAGTGAATTASPYSGSWFFPRSKSAPVRKDLYPPEFIEMTVSEEGGRLRGVYRARYRIPDRPITPEVMFRFEGPSTQQSPARFAWTGAGGARGEVQLVKLSENSVEVNWLVDQLGEKWGLASGTAVLIRRME